ncbi:hypothetical protein SH661x_003813 [Planctomicrobium sp. SH661]|uniref:hypothetical protein n=1 Tax=Planctomicrobium sp. SH661 TaxID=3448124 RepID=UPI003F5B18C3
MLVRRPHFAVRASRRGSLLPGIVLAILICGGCMALVFNEYWLTNVQEELRTSTQAVALAAAQGLASDDLLKPEVDPYAISDRVREIADEQANRNQVGGPQTGRMEVHLGRVLFDPATGQQETIETDEYPNSVVVIGHRDRSRNNPVAMLAPLLSGRSVADVTVTAEASITNLIAGLRAFGPVDVPAWPIAILESSSDSKVQTWNKEIELRQGSDLFSWNAETQTVEEAPDGLPEILLLPKGQQGTNNAYLVDIGNGLQDAEIDRQIHDGWSAEDLSGFGEYFSLQQDPLDLEATDKFSGGPMEALESQIGQLRILLLYSTVSGGKDGKTQVKVTRLVAGRLMHLSENREGPQLTFQPGVIVTRTAVLDEEALYQGDAQGNPYIYKLSITQ